MRDPAQHARHRASLLMPLLAAWTAACEGTPVAPSDAGLFTFSPVALVAVDTINPLGHMTTPFNVLPQGRIYFVLRNRSAMNPVVAPASGTVTWMLGPKPDYRVEVQVSPTLKWYVDHVLPEPGIAVGVTVAAGQTVARHSGATCCVDFGVLNTQLVLAGYLERGRYSPETLHADAPLKYFAEPLRGEMYARVNRFAGDRDGKHDFDVAGRLSGNWFLAGTPVAGSLLPENWARQLAFAYSNTHPATVLISVGGTLPLQNLLAVHDGAPDPVTVSESSGAVTYRLYQKSPPVSEGNLKGSTPLGVMLVQLIAPDRIRVEIAVGAAATLTSFSDAALVYTR
ncbi:MAG: hypothetical protein FJ207_14970 [Gemmatimonadetes bacterium]|nr:hypothetical protein [Gemmatimonadota bacterium]